MKKTRRLVVTRETLRALGGNELAAVAGGDTGRADCGQRVALLAATAAVGCVAMELATG